MAEIAEIAAGAAGVLVAAGAIVDAAGAADVPVAADGIVGAAGLAEEGTRSFAADLHGFTDVKKATAASRGLFMFYGALGGSYVRSDSETV
jgi:hypothetical protein